MILDEVDGETRAVLERYGFDAERFEQLRVRVAEGSLSPGSNVVRGEVEPPAAEDLTALPEPETPGWEQARATGLASLRRGELAQIVLNGGMATRFGGVVKGVVEAVDGKSFLELKLAETTALGDALGAPIPTVVMTSFATDDPTRALVAERGLPEPRFFTQSVLLRLGPDGSLFRDRDGRASLYGPGHGDVLEAVRTSGTVGELRGAGVRHVQISNVDNLGARIDPAILGAHVLSGRPLTIEVAPRGGDLGGAPARVDGRPMLLESFRFPPGFDQNRIPVFNTNTAWLTLEALDRDYSLTWLYVEKEVDDRVAVQLERLYHEASAFLDTTFLVVPRAGPRGRFFPIKTPQQLEAVRPALRELLAHSLVT